VGRKVVPDFCVGWNSTLYFLDHPPFYIIGFIAVERRGCWGSYCTLHHAPRTAINRYTEESTTGEAEAIVSELTTKQPGGGPPIGIDAPLDDDEGYPRADIDVYRARTLRKRFKEIQTNVKVLEKKIEFGLVEIAAQSTKKTSGGSNIHAKTMLLMMRRKRN
jgi:hypothetical protein